MTTGGGRWGPNVSVQDGLKAIRRLWPVIVACGLVAGVLMWLITPVAINTERKVASFDAIATLLVTVRSPLGQPDSRPGTDTASAPTPSATPTPSPSPTSSPRRTATRARTPTPTPSPTPTVTDADRSLALNRVALLVRTGEIPHLAAQALDYRGDPAVLARRVDVEADSGSSAVMISMTSKDSRPAVETVNAFARGSVAYFEGPGRDTGIEVLLLEEATALPNETTEAYVAPPSKWGRTLIAATIGLLLGVGLVLVLGPLDPRLRGRRQVAEALALPVLAEISRSRRHPRSPVRVVAVIDAPRSAEADGYRVLRSAVLHARTQQESAGTGSAAYVIVVTSLAGGADETVVNLAAGLADDQRVLVVDGDLREPGLHHWFDVPDSEGVVDFLADPRAELATLARPTRVPGVQLITAGSGGNEPASVVSMMGRVVVAVQGIADVVIIKASPLLSASEVFDLVPLADMVLLAVRDGRLEPAAARRARDLLHRFPHTDAGVVLLERGPGAARTPRTADRISDTRIGDRGRAS